MKTRICFIVKIAKKNIVFLFFCFFCLGVVIYLEFKPSLHVFFLFISILLYLFISLKSKAIVVVIIAVLLGFLRGIIFRGYIRSEKNISNYNGTSVEIEGTIENIKSEGKICAIAVNTKNITVESVSEGAGRISGGVLVETKCPDNIALGKEILIYGLLEEPPEFEDFSYRDYLLTKGIFSIIKAEKCEVIEDERIKIKTILYYFKNKLSRNFSQILPEPHASLLKGIVYGDVDLMSENFFSQLRRSGTTHVVAVSGYNITVLIACIGIFAPVIGRKFLHIGSIIFIVVFMFFVGVDNIPVVRASLMGISFSIAGGIGRKRGLINVFSGLIAIFILLNPLIYKQISFQLSFLSTIGLMLFTDILGDKLWFIPKFLREDTASTLSAIMTTLPVTLYNFYEFSLISPLVNLIVLPVVPFVTIAGFCFVIVICVFPRVGALLSPVLWLPLEYFIQVIKLFGSQESVLLGFNPQIGKGLSVLLTIFLIILSFEIIYKKQNKSFNKKTV